MEKKPLVDKEYIMERFPGKGGWTYILLPEVPKPPSGTFGMIEVSGTIDSYDLGETKLMPFGNGISFLPVKAEIRKKIGKNFGDSVHLKLYKTIETITVVPDEILACFETESTPVLTYFKNMDHEEQLAQIRWIYNAPNEDNKAQRILEMIERVKKKMRGIH